VGPAGTRGREARRRLAAGRVARRVAPAAALLLSLACASLGRAPGLETPEALSAAFLARLAEPACERAAELYHQPADLPADQRTREVEEIATSLDVFVGDFGPLVAWERAIEERALLGIDIESASPDYWARFAPGRAAESQLFWVRFERVTPAFVRLRMIETDAGWMLRSTNIGIALAGPYAQRRMLELMQKLQQALGKLE
jgi:hypothetical protein